MWKSVPALGLIKTCYIFGPRIVACSSLRYFAWSADLLLICAQRRHGRTFCLCWDSALGRSLAGFFPFMEIAGCTNLTLMNVCSAFESHMYASFLLMKVRSYHGPSLESSSQYTCHWMWVDLRWKCARTITPLHGHMSVFVPKQGIFRHWALAATYASSPACENHLNFCP